MILRSTSIQSWKHRIMQVNYKSVLVNKGFGFDPISRQWFDGKKQVDSSVPHIFLIRAFKSCGYLDAGSRAESAMVNAECSPDLTFAAFKKRFLRRDYSARVRGVDIFLAWGKAVGIEIDTANLLLWCRKHPFILHRFYEVAAAAGIRIKNCARIWGLKGVFRHVFCGFKLVMTRASGNTGSDTTSNNTSGNMSGPAGDDTNDAYYHSTKPVFSGP